MYSQANVKPFGALYFWSADVFLPKRKRMKGKLFFFFIGPSVAEWQSSYISEPESFGANLSLCFFFNVLMNLSERSSLISFRNIQHRFKVYSLFIDSTNKQNQKTNIQNAKQQQHPAWDLDNISLKYRWPVHQRGVPQDSQWDVRRNGVEKCCQYYWSKHLLDLYTRKRFWWSSTQVCSTKSLRFWIQLLEGQR